jgi:hypothetical protein
LWVVLTTNTTLGYKGFQWVILTTNTTLCHTGFQWVVLTTNTTLCYKGFHDWKSLYHNVVLVVSTTHWKPL